MKVRKMERAENSDLDTSLATVNMRNIFREKKFRRKVPFKYANWRTQLGKEIYISRRSIYGYSILSRLGYSILRECTLQKRASRHN